MGRPLRRRSRPTVGAKVLCRASLVCLILGAVTACQTTGDENAVEVPERTDRVISAPDAMDGGAGLVGTASAPAGDWLEAMRKGQFHNAFGDQAAAESAFRTALLMIEAESGPESARVLGPLLQLALTVSIQHRVSEAEALFSRAGRLLDRDGSSPWDRARYQTYRGIHLSSLGDLDRAFALARTANLARRDQLRVDAARQASGEVATMAGGLAELAHGLLVESTLALRLQRLDVAEVSAGLARKILVKLTVAPDWWLAEVDELVGRIEAQRRQFVAARDRVETALTVKRATFGERRPVAMTMLSLGQIRHLEGVNDDAMATMQRGIDILRSDPRNTTDLGFGILASFISAGLDAVRADPAAAARLNDEMFQASQLVFQGVTSRTINLTVARLTAGEEEAGNLVRRLQQTVHRRDALRLALSRETAHPPAERNAARESTLREAVAAAEERIATVDASLRETAPGLATFLAPEPVDVAALSGLLRDREVLLAFAVGAEGAFLFAARGTRIAVAELPLDDKALVRRVSHLRAAFETDVTGAFGTYDLAAAHDLFVQLTDPVREMLVGADHLVIVPSGALASLPFGILLHKPPLSDGADRYRRAAWVAGRFAVSSFPSVRAFADLRRLGGGSQAPLPLLGMADPALTGDRTGIQEIATACIEGAAAPDLVRAMPPLPETRGELSRVGGLLGARAGDMATGRRATESWLRGRKLDQYRILYFATHGVLPGELRCQTEPALVFTPPERPVGAERDGLLTASEVATLSLDADLVVLSACNTAGASGIFGGEALSGLARSFFHAGTRSLLVSHWQVNSATTARLMTRLFELSTQGRTIADSLRSAKRAMIDRPETAHPGFWGAFTLKGDGARILRMSAEG